MTRPLVCEEGVDRDGRFQPCDRPAVGIATDCAEGHPQHYPACHEHADMVEAGLWMCVKHERTTPYIERTSGPCGEGWSGCVWHRLYREARR